MLAAVLVVAAVNHQMRRQAYVEAEAKAKILLDRTMAVHEYFRDELKPRVFAMTDPYRGKDYFDPTWMSSTFANRKIDQSFNKNNPSYYFKNCAVNARSPENEATDYERDFVRELNENPDLMVRSSIRMFDGKPFFVLLRRGETMEESCLPCHDVPESAPQGLVEWYGPERSFQRKIGEVISAQSLRIPLAEAYQEADRFSLQLSLMLLGVLGILFWAQYFLYEKLLVGPLGEVRKRAAAIASNDEKIGEEIPLPQGRDMAEMVGTFNTMSKALRRHIDNLEELVVERTAQLEGTNQRLAAEVEERKRTENEKEKLIVELQASLTQVKTLRGIIPICMHCKQIRDDAGFWSRVEAYLSEHTLAELSHGICPDCVKKYYPDMRLGQKDESA